MKRRDSDLQRHPQTIDGNTSRQRAPGQDDSTVTGVEMNMTKHAEREEQNDEAVAFQVQAMELDRIEEEQAQVHDPSEDDMEGMENLDDDDDEDDDGVEEGDGRGQGQAANAQTQEDEDDDDDDEAESDGEEGHGHDDNSLVVTMFPESSTRIVLAPQDPAVSNTFFGGHGHGFGGMAMDTSLGPGRASDQITDNLLRAIAAHTVAATTSARFSRESFHDPTPSASSRSSHHRPGSNGLALRGTRTSTINGTNGINGTSGTATEGTHVQVPTSLDPREACDGEMQALVERMQWACRICFNVPLHPCKTPCGHIYCLDCIGKHLTATSTSHAHAYAVYGHAHGNGGTSVKCPTCSKIMNRRGDWNAEDEYLQRIMRAQLQIKCVDEDGEHDSPSPDTTASESSTSASSMSTPKSGPAHAPLTPAATPAATTISGCSWRGLLGDWQEHLTKQCPRTKVRCPRCQEAVIPRGQIADHQLVACKKRPVDCEHCLARIPHDCYTERHGSRCAQRLVGCWLECGQQIRAGEMTSHMAPETGTCTRRRVRCPFCGQSEVEAGKLVGHFESTCTKRPARCSAGTCQTWWPTPEARSQHEQHCELIVLPCPNGCAQRGPRGSWLAKHCQAECSLRIVRCRYSRFGCPTHCPVMQMAEHLVSQAKEHQDLVVRMVDAEGDSPAIPVPFGTSNSPPTLQPVVESYDPTMGSVLPTQPFSFPMAMDEGVGPGPGYHKATTPSPSPLFWTSTLGLPPSGSPAREFFSDAPPPLCILDRHGNLVTAYRVPGPWPSSTQHPPTVQAQPQSLPGRERAIKSIPNVSLTMTSSSPGALRTSCPSSSSTSSISVQPSSSNPISSSTPASASASVAISHCQSQTSSTTSPSLLAHGPTSRGMYHTEMAVTQGIGALRAARSIVHMDDGELPYTTFRLRLVPSFEYAQRNLAELSRGCVLFKTFVGTNARCWWVPARLVGIDPASQLLRILPIREGRGPGSSVLDTGAGAGAGSPAGLGGALQSHSRVMSAAAFFGLSSSAADSEQSPDPSPRLRLRGTLSAGGQHATWVSPFAGRVAHFPTKQDFWRPMNSMLPALSEFPVVQISMVTPVSLADAMTTRLRNDETVERPSGVCPEVVHQQDGIALLELHVQSRNPGGAANACRYMWWEFQGGQLSEYV